MGRVPRVAFCKKWRLYASALILGKLAKENGPTWFTIYSVSISRIPTDRPIHKSNEIDIGNIR